MAAALKKFGFSAASIAERPLLTSNKFIRIGEQPVRVEIHGGISGVDFDDCYARGETCDVQGIRVPFISLADLRRNKSAAGRTKDQADLEALPDA